MKTMDYTHEEAVKIASVAHAQGWNGRGVFSFSDLSSAKMWKTLKELKLLNKNAPKEAEPITPEALEKEPGWEKGYYADDCAEYSNGAVFVEYSFFIKSAVAHIFSTDDESGYCTVAKGVATMPELRLLTTLINGKA